MDISGWDARYRSRERSKEDFDAPPTPLLVRIAKDLKPGRALDLACGSGRNALWLCQRGWRVTATDGSPAAIAALQENAAAREVGSDSLRTEVVDLENPNFQIAPAAWDLILMAYYLQRDLFEPAKRGVVPGGLVLIIVHLAEDGRTSDHALQPGQLCRYFDDWEIVHSYEGKPNDPAHQRSVAEIVARRPVGHRGSIQQ